MQDLHTITTSTTTCTLQQQQQQQSLAVTASNKSAVTDAVSVPTNRLVPEVST